MKKFIFTFIFLILFSSHSISSISQYYGTTKINLDEIGVVNLARYLDGRFYGEDLSREMHNNSPMYYAISEDGKIGYGWFCRASVSNACSDDFTAFRVVEYCKEYTKQNCGIFAIGNLIVWNNASILIDSFDFNKIIELLKKNNFYKENLTNKVNQNNYLSFVNLTIDQCSNKKVSADNSNLRGAALNCLLPGRFERAAGDKAGDSLP
jgi:hypothetical protein